MGLAGGKYLRRRRAPVRPDVPAQGNEKYVGIRFCFVDMALEWLWSPEQIIGVGKRIGKAVSHERIYRHVA